jgi:hypothetical protein
LTGGIRAGLPNLLLAFAKGGRAQTKILIPSVNTFDRRYELVAIEQELGLD